MRQPPFPLPLHPRSPLKMMKTTAKDGSSAPGSCRTDRSPFAHLSGRTETVELSGSPAASVNLSRCYFSFNVKFIPLVGVVLQHSLPRGRAWRRLGSPGGAAMTELAQR